MKFIWWNKLTAQKAKAFLDFMNIFIGKCFQDPAVATLQIGTETYYSQDTLATRARHYVLLRALNETQYKFTTLPQAIKEFSAQKDSCTKDKPATDTPS